MLSANQPSQWWHARRPCDSQTAFSIHQWPANCERRSGFQRLMERFKAHTDQTEHVFSVTMGQVDE